MVLLEWFSDWPLYSLLPDELKLCLLHFLALARRSSISLCLIQGSIQRRVRCRLFSFWPENGGNKTRANVA